MPRTFISRQQTERGGNRGDVMRQKPNCSGPGDEVGAAAPSWNQRVMCVDPLRVWAPAAEAGSLLPSALFSKHLRPFEHGGSVITPACRSLSSRPSFAAFLLVPLYGNQSTSNPDRPSVPVLHVSLRLSARVGSRYVGRNFKELQVAPL